MMQLLLAGGWYCFWRANMPWAKLLRPVLLLVLGGFLTRFIERHALLDE